MTLKPLPMTMMMCRSDNEDIPNEEQKFRLQRLHSGINSTSSLETRIFNILNTWKSIRKDFDFKSHFYIGRRNYDFLINNNVVLEVQGDYWYCNPKKYKSDDIFEFTNGIFIASDVWKKDEEKQSLALDQGYKVVYIWEDEMKRLSDFDLENLLIERLQ